MARVVVTWDGGWGPDGVKHPVGTVIDLEPPQLGEALRMGFVELAGAAPKVETAAASPAENTAVRTAKPAAPKARSSRPAKEA